MPEPKLVEIDEADLLRLRRVDNVVREMERNPSAKKKLLNALKDVRPDDPAVKGLERPDPTEQRFTAQEETINALKKQIEDDKAERERQDKLGRLQADQDRAFEALRAEKWTEDGIAKVKKVMEDKGILDVAIAAKWVESQMPPQSPLSPIGTGAWNFMDQVNDGEADLKKLIETRGENDSLLRKMAGEAISELRGTAPRR